MCLLILVGALGTLAQVLQTLGYKYAEASTIAPLEYLSMVAAVLSGYFVFGELPHPSIWIGAPLVIAVGLVIFWREFGNRTRVRQPNICPAAERGE